MHRGLWGFDASLIPFVPMETARVQKRKQLRLADTFFSFLKWQESGCACFLWKHHHAEFRCLSFHLLSSTSPKVLYLFFEKMKGCVLETALYFILCYLLSLPKLVKICVLMKLYFDLCVDLSCWFHFPMDSLSLLTSSASSQGHWHGGRDEHSCWEEGQLLFCLFILTVIS